MLQQGQQTELTLNLVKYFDVQTAQIRKNKNKYEKYKCMQKEHKDFFSDNRLVSCFWFFFSKQNIHLMLQLNFTGLHSTRMPADMGHSNSYLLKGQKFTQNICNILMKT